MLRVARFVKKTQKRACPGRTGRELWVVDFGTQAVFLSA